MDILIATTNQGKFTEIMEVLEPLTKNGINFLSLRDVVIEGEPIEDGDTYKANALIKAKYYFEQSGLPTIAEDSGIEIEALKGQLGKHTRRWGAGPHATDEEWITHFLRVMETESNKKAVFHCHSCFIHPDGSVHHFAGTCSGLITQELEAPILKGIPISSCFRPEGYKKVYAALQTEEKNKLSHRGKAIQMLFQHLQSHWSQT